MTDKGTSNHPKPPELPPNWPNRDLSSFRTTAGVRWHVQLGSPSSPELRVPAIPTVLLLHGTGGSVHQWAEVLPSLAPHARVVAVDLPGHGFSVHVGGEHAEPDPFSLVGMARAVASLLRSLNARPEVIVGHSAGAAVALRMTLDGLVSPRSIVGFNPALIPPPEIWVELLAPFAGLLVESSWLARSAAWVAGRGTVVRTLLESSGARLSEQQIAWYSVLFTNPAHCAAALAMMNRWNLPALARDAAGLGVPFTAYAGERDQWVPLSALEIQVARIPGASLVRVAGVGHLLPDESPSLATSAILESLANSVHSQP